MRWTDPLDEVFGSRAKVRILRCLWQAEGPLSGREVARRTGLSHTGVLRALRELDATQVVEWKRYGFEARYRLNNRHVIVAGGLVPLLEVEMGLEDALLQEIHSIAPDALAVVVFGSVARRKDGPRSDIDLLVVVPDGSDTEEVFDQLATLDSVRAFGKDIGPVVWTVSGLRKRSRAEHPLVESIKRDGRSLGGSDLPLIVETGGRVGARRTRGKTGRGTLPRKGKRVPPGGRRSVGAL